MNVRKPPIHWLDEFGLSLDRLTSLGRVMVKLRVDFRHIDEQTLFGLKPSDRVERIERHYNALLSRLRRCWSDGPIRVSWIGREPRGFAAAVEARRVSRLLRMPEVGSIWLDQVPGRKRKSKKLKARWFAVQARFGIQVEGQTAGLQSFEDRIVVVKALNFEAAERKVQPEFRKYGRPYLNPHGFMVRWKFERVLDVHEIGDEAIDPRGTEVFSVMARRRVKPEFAWKVERRVQVHRK